MSSRSVRLYMVRDTYPTIVGREVARSGSAITLNVAEPNWPFPRLRNYQRDCLVHVGGPAEPVPFDDRPWFEERKRAQAAGL